ncbi:MAG: NlpC/P60 family protein [Rhizobiaceae bacterium]|nr:NlpC/P60 family protein [Rhizobiaceae bacterium]
MSDLPQLDPHDRRLNPLDETGTPVKGEGTSASIRVAFTELRREPDMACAIDTQLMFGQRVNVYDIQAGWAWVQAERDGYVGWLEETTLDHDPVDTTHLVSAPRTFFYPEPDLKLPHKGMRSMGSELSVVDYTETRGTQYAILAGGEAVIASHIRAKDDHADDFVSIAESLLLTPYLWAGTTAFGIDCSGFVHLAMFMSGKNVLRDSDMQAATIGSEIDPGADHQQVHRGDLIFWRGHVGICHGLDETGQQMLLHANGHSMNVLSEPLIPAIERIAYLYEMPIGVRRP